MSFFKLETIIVHLMQIKHNKANIIALYKKKSRHRTSGVSGVTGTSLAKNQDQYQ